MSPDDIKPGVLYRGSGAISIREIDHMWQNDKGEWIVHWWCFLPVETKTRTFHTPNRTCTLKHFAKWAIAIEGKSP